MQASEQVPDLPELCVFFPQQLESQWYGSASRRFGRTSCMQRVTYIRNSVGFVRRVLGQKDTGMLVRPGQTRFSKRAAD